MNRENDYNNLVINVSSEYILKPKNCYSVNIEQFNVKSDTTSYYRRRAQTRIKNFKSTLMIENKK